MVSNSHLTDYLKSHAQDSPDKLALITDDRSLSWKELWQLVEAGAAHLDSLLPSKPQQIVAILMPNSWQYVVTYLSIVHAGHMALPIDIIFKSLEIDAVLAQVPPALIITDQINKGRISTGRSKILDIAKFPLNAPNQRSNYLRLPATKQIACLLFTSGTTGKPKVVPNTHHNHIWNIQTCSKVWDWTADDTQLVSLRLSHMHGIVMGLAGSLYHGNTMYLQDRFDAQATLGMLASGKISMFTHGPQAYAKMLEVAARKDYDLSKVRLCISGSGPLPPSIWQEFKAVFDHEIVEAYGTSETGRIASNLLDERIPGSPGRPLPGVEVRIDNQGEVLVKSAGVFPGYLNNPEATDKSRSSDGFWRTGDIGEFINGRLILKGRTQERIRRKGYTISPRDIEWALYTNPKIKEVLVVGVQTPGQSDDRLVYFIVGQITADEVRDFSKANLPSVWRADKTIILNELPRTRSGKPRLAELKGMVKW